MKIKLEYEYQLTVAPHFFVKATVNGESIYRCGATWGEARRRMLKELPLILADRTIPEPEEVEILI